MEFRKPKAKKNSTFKGGILLPSKNEKQILGVFNGQFVTVHDWDSMNYLYETGNFGKGSLSKGQPNYHINKDDIARVMVEYQYDNHVKCCENSSYLCPQKYSGSFKNDFKLSLQSVSHFLDSTFNDDKQETWKSWKEKQQQASGTFKQTINQPLLEFKTDLSDYKDEVFSSLVNDILDSRQIKKSSNFMLVSEEVIVLNLSCPLSDFSVTNANVVLKKLPFAPQEHLNLSLEESFFLKSVLGCLNVVDLNFCEIKIPDLWEKFNSIDKNFTERYISYSYYRNKGWVVRSGLKFGGDFLLYKDGPAYYHASYLVKVLDRRKKLTWREFIAMNRLVETFNKDLLLCEVRCDENSKDKNYPGANHSVQELLVRRWFPSRERVAQESTSN